MIKTLQFIAGTLVYTNFYCKGRKVATKSRKEDILVFDVTPRNLSALCGSKRIKISFFLKPMNF